MPARRPGVTSLELEVSFEDWVTSSKHFRKAVKSFGHRLGLRVKILTVAGPSGWPVVRFTGTAAQIEQLLEKFEV
jgi:hypothetical protein